MIIHSLPYISGMAYRYLTDFKYDEFEQFDINIIKQFDGMKLFMKTDFLKKFIKDILPKITENFILFSHNSDIEIDSKYFEILDNNFLIEWNAQNINIIHEKLKSIPIGIANSRWEHGNSELLTKVINKKNKKNRIVYCNFDIKTNIIERTKCLYNINPIKIENRVDFETYLNNLSESYFTISPNGNGVDCHKHWESLYLKTIPIVTKSINIDYYKDYPFLVIDDWSEFKKLKLTEKLYNEIMKKYNENKLYMI